VGSNALGQLGLAGLGREVGDPEVVGGLPEGGAAAVWAGENHSMALAQAWHGEGGGGERAPILSSSCFSLDGRGEAFVHDSTDREQSHSHVVLTGGAWLRVVVMPTGVGVGVGPLAAAGAGRGLGAAGGSHLQDPRPPG
jgi:hypothetical protein